MTVRILVLAPQPFFQNRGTPIATRRLLSLLALEGYQLDLLTYPEGESIELPNCQIHRVPRLPLGDLWRAPTPYTPSALVTTRGSECGDIDRHAACATR